MKIIELTKKLISIPSYVGTNCDEKKIADFIFECLIDKSIFLKVIKQPITKNRYNIIAYDKYPTNLLICGHIDTVEPKDGEKMITKLKNNKIYGLGSTDMKGNIAAIICALEKFKETKGLMILFYVDEEYDFLGIKAFLKKYKSKIKPKNIISGDGYGLTISNGCRGLIELSCKAKGATGHAANPQSGKNAISGSVEAVKKLSNYLAQEYSSEKLGQTSCNLAFLQGGLYLGVENNQVVIGRQGNNIPDFAEFILDIRPANNNLTAQKLIELIKIYLENQGLILENVKIRHDLKPWFTPRNQLKSIEQTISKTIEAKFDSINESGYIDLQMLWETFDKVPCLTFGGGEKYLAHKSGEYITINNILKTEEVYEDLIDNLGGGVKK